MAKKSATSVGNKEKIFNLPPAPVVRVEESVEEFISLHLPGCGNATLKVMPLWTNSKGQRYFRCNFWKIIPGTIMNTSTIIMSKLIRIESDGSKMTLSDITEDRPK